MNFESIHNYYEHLVIEYVINTVAKSGEFDENGLEDIVCLALNQLPARYVRHNVDMAFFLTSKDRQTMQDNITKAVEKATETVRDRSSLDD